MRWIFILFLPACSTIPLQEAKEQASASMPLSSRTLEISTTIPGTDYPYRVCTRKVIGICLDWSLAFDNYDFNDVAVRKTLSDAGFVCRVEVKP